MALAFLAMMAWMLQILLKKLLTWEVCLAMMSWILQKLLKTQWMADHVIQLTTPARRSIVSTLRLNQRLGQ
jgi:uncharacterized protein YggT (Ycf19 family)